MRELTLRIRFTRACLGNVAGKKATRGKLTFSRGPQGHVLFLASWHKANMRLASQVLGRHQDEVEKILWDINVDGVVKPECAFRRYYKTSSGAMRFALHESFAAGQVVGINCAVPASIDDDDMRRLMNMAGRYKGLSPFQPGEFGLFEVEEILPRSKVNSVSGTEVA